MTNIEKLLSGDKLALSRAISEVENKNGEYILKKIFPYTGNSYYIGITGPPGAGKSTIVSKLAYRFLNNHKKIGIIAVDPTSPFSGGALLGDRIRMSELTTQEGVFIRSMASRGSLGGLAQKTKDVVLLFDAFGMEYIIIETIGVGQVELDVREVCDTTVVVLVPESGDSIQAMKAGLLEIADIIVVNKADREGADRMMRELEFILELREKKEKWKPPVIKTIAIEDKGIEDIISQIESHKKYLKESGNFEIKRKDKIKLRIEELIENRIKKYIKKKITQENLDEFINKIYNKELNMFDVIQKFNLESILGK